MTKRSIDFGVRPASWASFAMRSCCAGVNVKDRMRIAPQSIPRAVARGFQIETPEANAKAEIAADSERRAHGRSAIAYTGTTLNLVTG